VDLSSESYNLITNLTLKMETFRPTLFIAGNFEKLSWDVLGRLVICKKKELIYKKILDDGSLNQFKHNVLIINFGI